MPINSRFEEKDQRISALEHRSNEIIQYEEQKQKKNDEREQSQRPVKLFQMYQHKHMFWGSQNELRDRKG